MQAYNGFIPDPMQQQSGGPYGEGPPHQPAQIDFSAVKGVYKNCRGIWAAQWTDEKGQRHTKYFNPKFFASEQTARVEAYKFKVAIQREIEAKGGVQRKRSQTIRARQTPGRRAEFELMPNSGRRIRRSGLQHTLTYRGGANYGGGSDYGNASPELLAMLQSVNVAGLSGDPAVIEPILSWQQHQGGMPISPGQWSHMRNSDSLYRTGESVNGAQLSERMLEGFSTYWQQTLHYQQVSWYHHQHHHQPMDAAYQEAQIVYPDQVWWPEGSQRHESLPVATLCSEPLRNLCPEAQLWTANSAPPIALRTAPLNEHPAIAVCGDAAQTGGFVFHMMDTTEARTEPMDETAQLPEQMQQC